MSNSQRPVGENFNRIFRRICRKQNLKNPVELLVGLANGVDLTTTSAVYDFAEKLKEDHGEDLPDDFDYLELLELIKNSHQFVTVDFNTRMQAQKTLVEYQHPKRKSVEVVNKSEGGAVSELTAKEVRIFKRKFNARY